MLGDGAGIGQHLGAGLGQVNALADLLEQRPGPGLLQLLDLHGDGGLAEVQLGAGARKAAAAGDRFEDVQLMEGEPDHKKYFDIVS